MVPASGEGEHIQRYQFWICKYLGKCSVASRRGRYSSAVSEEGGACYDLRHPTGQWPFAILSLPNTPGMRSLDLLSVLTHFAHDADADCKYSFLLFLCAGRLFSSCDVFSISLLFSQVCTCHHFCFFRSCVLPIRSVALSVNFVVPKRRNLV